MSNIEAEWQWKYTSLFYKTIQWKGKGKSYISILQLDKCTSRCSIVTIETEDLFWTYTPPPPSPFPLWATLRRIILPVKLLITQV